MLEKFRKFIKAQGVGVFLTLFSILIVTLLDWLGVFDVLELKTYDYRFTTVRGPLTGWRAADSTIINLGTDVVLVELDDEAWRLMPEKWPYPRGRVWARIIRNLSQAGAKVIAFDIQFDSSDMYSEYIRGFMKEIEADENWPSMPKHGDDIFGEAIAEVKAHGTTVIISTKMVKEPNSIPPEYISMPVPAIMKGNPETGLINDLMDRDGFSRQYAIYGQMEHEPDKYYLTLGLKAVKAFLDIPDTALTYFSKKDNICRYGPLRIKTHGYGNSFLVNYYGPPSGYKLTSDTNLPAWGTFPRYSLAYIYDTDEVELKDPAEDIDWMSQFLPGKVPDWIEAIEDPQERQEMIELMGLGEEYDVTKSPFYNKIVIIGVAVEVIHDTKSTPYYNYMGVQQLTPGMETHANAIQTILHGNYLNVLGGRIIDLFHDYPFSRFLVVAGLSLIAFLLLMYLNPVVAGILIFIEGLIYFGIACGLFTGDLLWMVKKFSAVILPNSFVTNHMNWFTVHLPGVGESTVIPIVVPLAGILVTYTSNVIYRFLIEQRDKKFLKDTFGTYISPELIEKMYEEKQEPKLGGETGYLTAFFSDIQSFSSFSEVLEPERMVALMNEYLTEMTTVLLNRRGTLDKYIGDAIVAFYGAPVPVEDHEFQACMTALEMGYRLAELREKWKQEEGWPEIVHNIQHRIGLCTGNMVTGNMGSTMRMNYTMMGDTVNIAARLESSAKQYGVYIQVAENTYSAVKDQFEWRFLDYVRVKGKKVPVKVYELLAEKGKLDEQNRKAVEAFHEAQKLYFEQKWDLALEAFREAEKLEVMFPGRNTNPSAVFITRCEYLKQNPPGDDWDGVWTLTAK
jgi:adenylate cyclase